jgi:hypothetical protein
MTRDISVSALALIALSVSLKSIAQVPPPDGHPLMGKWQWTRPQNRCTEVYEFRPDGTVPVTSGAEKTENTFT